VLVFDHALAAFSSGMFAVFERSVEAACAKVPVPFDLIAPVTAPGSLAMVRLAPSLTVRAALTTSKVSVRPADSGVDEVAAMVRSKAALVSRIPSPVRPATVPPVIATEAAFCVAIVPRPRAVLEPLWSVNTGATVNVCVAAQVWASGCAVTSVVVSEPPTVEMAPVRIGNDPARNRPVTAFACETSSAPKPMVDPVASTRKA